MSASDFVKNSCHGVVTVVMHDTNGADVEHEELFDLGDVACTGLSRELNELVMHQRRGRRVSEDNGAKKYPGLSLSSFVTSLMNAASPGSLAEAIFGVGAYSDTVSVTGAGRRRAVHVRLHIEGTDIGDDDDDDLECRICYPDTGFGEAMDGDKLSTSFTVCGDVILNDVVICSDLGERSGQAAS